MVVPGCVSTIESKARRSGPNPCANPRRRCLDLCRSHLNPWTVPACRNTGQWSLSDNVKVLAKESSYRGDHCPARLRRGSLRRNSMNSSPWSTNALNGTGCGAGRGLSPSSRPSKRFWSISHQYHRGGDHRADVHRPGNYLPRERAGRGFSQGRRRSAARCRARRS